MLFSTFFHCIIWYCALICVQVYIYLLNTMISYHLLVDAAPTARKAYVPIMKYSILLHALIKI